MSIPVLRSRGILDRLRDPLWLPLASALAAYIGWQVAGIAAARPVLVPRNTLAAGTRLSPSLVRTMAWPGPLPTPALAEPSGTLRVAAQAGLPLLIGEVRAGTAVSRTPADPVLAIPSASLLSAPPLSPSTAVSVYLAPTGSVPQLISAHATVWRGSTAQNILLAVPPADLQAMVDAIAAGRLLVVEHP